MKNMISNNTQTANSNLLFVLSDHGIIISPTAKNKTIKNEVFKMYEHKNVPNTKNNICIYA